jgi:methionyl-tRNA synthetase
MLAAAEGLPGKGRAAIQDFALHIMLAEIWAVVADANRYFASQQPWVLRKSDPARMGTVLYVTAEVLRCVGIAALPFIPEAAGKLLDFLAVTADERTLAAIDSRQRLAGGIGLPQPEPIFPRYVETEA